MYLSKDEEKALEGENGEAQAIAMNLMVTLGDIFEAKRLISVKSAQISGISYKTIGDSGLEFIENFTKLGAKVSVYTTINPTGMDLENWRELGIPEDFANKQNKVISSLMDIGVIPTCTCTPYLLPNKPEFGEHLAWAESSAVIFANSVIGARTNREGGPMALASAIIGKTPLYGLHLEENRMPSIKVNVKAELKNELDYSLLGFFIGKNIPTDIPFIELPRPETDKVSLKALGASMATSGGHAIYHVAHLTPESKTYIKKKNFEHLNVEYSDLNKIKDTLSIEDRPDYVCIGCPHCSIEEMEIISKLAANKHFIKKVLIFTSRHIWNIAKAKGYVDTISKAGGFVVKDTCMVVAPLERLGIKHIMTNSSKAAYYLPSLCHAETVLRDLKGAMDYAIRGN